jgi:hypothetical protein
MVTLSEIQEAFSFVSSAGHGMNRALLFKDNDEIYYHSEMDDLDELDEDESKCNNFVEIPHKNDLDLGQSLVFEFAELHLADDLSRIDQIFHGRGAYGRFKDLLESKGLLQSWYDFENRREEEALREWARENEIELES